MTAIQDNGYEQELRLNGVEGFVFSVKNEGQSLVICGWTTAHLFWKPGERFLFHSFDGTKTRYQLQKVRSCGDPLDMYFADFVFLPRTYSPSR